MNTTTKQLRERIAGTLLKGRVRYPETADKPELHYGFPIYFLGEVVDDILSLLEPVELEALGSEEIMDIEESVEDKVFSGRETLGKGYVISQATIQHNQAKGQLYRIRSEKE